MMLIIHYRVSDQEQDTRALHFVRMGFEFTPKEEEFVLRNREAWPYTAGLYTRWSVAVHHTLLPEERQTIFTVLLCAKRRKLCLPPELWLCVFELLRRRDLRAPYPPRR